MTRAEGYSWCVLVSITALAWLAAGVPGALCLIVGLIVGNIDVSWIEASHAIPDDKPVQPVDAVRSSDAHHPHRELKSGGWKRLPLKPSAKVIPLKRKVQKT